MYLIVNLGLKSIRIIIFDEDGNQVYSNSRPVHTALLGSRVEQDAVEWLSLLDELMLEMKESTSLSKSITYVTSTTSSSCILGVNGAGQPLTKVLMVSDKRAISQSEAITKSPEYQSLLSAYSLNCNPSFVAPKALWFKEHEPELFEKIQYWVGAGEYLNHYFTGEYVTDALNASKAFYLGSDYPQSLYHSIGINPGTLPVVKPIGSSIDIKKSIIQKYVLNNQCKYVLTTYDAICAVIGSSTGEIGNACDVSGTVTSVRILTEKKVQSSSPMLLNQHIDLFDKFIVGSSNNLGGGIIEWYKQAFFDPDDTNVYFKMENYAQQSKVGANGLVFLPFLLGERSPHSMPEAKGTFFGVGRNSSITEFTRAVFESAGYITRGLLELITQNNVQINSLTVSGGMSRFDTINQIKSDVTNKPVYVVENFESTSIGALILVCVSLNVYASVVDAMKNTVRIRKIIRPSSKNNALYEDYYGLFTTLNASLLEHYKYHNSLLTKYYDHKNEMVRNL